MLGPVQFAKYVTGTYTPKASTKSLILPRNVPRKQALNPYWIHLQVGGISSCVHRYCKHNNAFEDGSMVIYFVALSTYPSAGLFEGSRRKTFDGYLADVAIQLRAASSPLTGPA